MLQFFAVNQNDTIIIEDDDSENNDTIILEGWNRVWASGGMKIEDFATATATLKEL
ncbi:MAG: hypothetical protein U5L09_22880 [Bacteroidales bacterium]|nr:hypothetical protein [Bacteroidales bacterium]